MPPRIHHLRPLLRCCALAALCCAGSLLAQEKPRESDIIYPRSAAPATSPVETKATDSLGRPLLFVALLAAAAGAWLLWRQRQGIGHGAGNAPRKLAIAESRSLGNRQYLVVADYDGRKFLLGVCPGRIDLLSPLDGDPAKKS
jgi:flagellar protein FliO/FliZ